MLIHTPSDIYFKRAGGTRAETLWDGKMFSSPQNGYAILGGPPTYPTKWRSHFAGTPISGTFVYLVPLARSRYCASPEASIMRLEAASTLAHKMAAQFWGPPKPQQAALINRCAAPYHRRVSVTNYALRTKHK